MLAPRSDPAAARSLRAPRFSRRSGLLALAGLVGTVGTTSCTEYDARPDRPGAGRTTGPVPPADPEVDPSTPEADPDVALAAAVLADEQEMIDRIVATTAAHPALAPLLAVTRAVHEQHVALLADAAPEVRASATSSPDAPVPEQPKARRPRKPSRVRQRDRAVTALARRETRLSLLDERSALVAESSAFARVLASMTAAASQQAVLLRAKADERP